MQAVTTRSGRRGASVLLFLAAAGIVTAAYFSFITPSGLLGGPDSAAYIGAARNIADGKGITLPFAQPFAEVRPSKAASVEGGAPLAQYFPGFPLLLSAPVAVGIAPATAAHVFNVLAAGLTVALVGAGALALTRGSYVASSVAMLLLVTTRSFATFLSTVSTEALFVPLCLGAVGALAFLLRRWSVRTALVFVVLAGAASLTRFVGISLAGAAVVGLVVQPVQPLTRRVGRALLVGVGAAAPGVVWQLYKMATGGTGGSGAIAYHPPGHSARGLLDIAAMWLNGRTKEFNLRAHVLTGPTVAVLVVVVVLLAGACVVIIRSRGASEELSFGAQLVLASAAFSVLYVALLWATVAFLVNATPFADERMLLPVLPVAVVLGVAAVASLLRGLSRWSTAGRAVALVAFVAVVVPVGLWHVSSARAAVRFQRSAAVRHAKLAPKTEPVYRELERLPRHALIFTNDPSDVWYVTGRYAASLPLRRSPWTGRRNTDFAAELDEIAPALCRHGGVLVTSRLAFANQPNGDELARARLVPDKQYATAVTYRPVCS